jgi:hypothetical protein
MAEAREVQDHAWRYTDMHVQWLYLDYGWHSMGFCRSCILFTRANWDPRGRHWSNTPRPATQQTWRIVNVVTINQTCSYTSSIRNTHWLRVIVLTFQITLHTIAACLVVMKSSIFWDITHCYLLHDGFLLGLFFDSEDRGEISLRNVGLFSADYISLYPRR